MGVIQKMAIGVSSLTVVLFVLRPWNASNLSSFHKIHGFGVSEPRKNGFFIECGALDGGSALL